jgi:hypothetical protein
MGRVSHDVSSAFGAVAVDLTSTDQVITSGCRGLHVGGSGTVKVDMPSAEGITFTGVTGILPIQVTKVYKTGTSATSIVALF